MERKTIWLDCDPGIDDAVAFFVALKLEQLNILGVSAVSGNVDVENTFVNARNLLALAKREDIKVYKGADRPLVQEREDAAAFHGKNGLGNVILKSSQASIESQVAWDAMYDCAKNNPGLTIVTIGPLTNLAIAICKYPDFVDYVKEVVMMGGCIDGGNTNLCAEFNIFADPQAAETVFKSGIKVHMVSLDATNKVKMTQEDLDQLYEMNNSISYFFKEAIKVPLALYQSEGKGNYFCAHDACTLIYCAYPQLFTTKECGIHVETQGSITMGKTVCDLWTDFKFADRHCVVTIDADREKIIAIIKDAFKKY